MADEKLGWEIDGRFYPHNGADALRHGDYALIREVTGLTLDAFDTGRDPIATETGWLAVAVWQANPDLSRAQVVEQVERLPRGAAKPIGWTKPLVEGEGEERPPAEAASTETSSTSAAPPAATDKTTDEAEQTPESITRNGSGSQQSATGHTLPLVTS